jgi:hypothetical protein
MSNVNWSNHTASGVAGQSIALGGLSDGGKSGTLTVSGIPVGATLSDGHGHSFLATSGNTTADLTGWTLTNLTIVDPSDVNFSLTANYSGATDIIVVTVSPAAPTITQVTDDVAPVTGIVSSGGSTNDTQPTVRVSISGTGAASGDTVQLYNVTTAIGSPITLTAANITNGYVDITPSSALTQGTYTFDAKITDAESNVSSASGSYTVTIDTSPPTAVATVTAISADTGTSTTDFITKTSSQTVSGTYTGTLATGESIMVSADGGATWVSATANATNHTWSASGVTLSQGSGTLSVETVDAAGNFTVGTGHSYTLDTTAPTVASVTAPAGDDGPGAVVGFTVNFGENVTVNTSGGTPTLMLSNGQTATYVGGSGTSALLFNYTVGATGSGQDSPDLKTAASGALVLHGGTITDAAGNAAVLTGADNVNPAGILQIDTTAPTISTVTDSPNSPNTHATTPVTITVNFSEAVTAGSGAAITLSDNGTAVYHGGSGTTQLTFTYTPGVSNNGVTVTGATGLTDAAGNAVTNFGETICFMAGTLIATPDGQAAVESLQAGDLVLGSDGRAHAVRWLGRQTVSLTFADPMKVLPIRIRAGALGEGLPVRDLLVSPDHAILVGEVLVQAGALVNGVSIVREADVPNTFTYYHVELDEHALVLAEGVPAETFIDNVQRRAFDNWRDYEALFPQGRELVEMPYPRAKAQRQVPRQVREQLQARAVVFGTVDTAA